MIWIVYGTIALGIAAALYAKIRRWESTEARFSETDDPPRTANGAPSFGTVFATVLKVIAALVIVLFAAMVALLLIDQHVHSLTR